MNTQSVCVYGTLRRGGSNHFRMDGAEFVGLGKIAGSIYLIDSNPELIFPALKLGTGENVVGELYRVSEAQLIELDAFEGISERYDEPYEYRRVKVRIEMDSGEVEYAWVWEWDGSLDEAKLLSDGDWLLYEPNPS